MTQQRSIWFRGLISGATLAGALLVTGCGDDHREARGGGGYNDGYQARADRGGSYERGRADGGDRSEGRYRGEDRDQARRGEEHGSESGAIPRDHDDFDRR